jgi:predicted nucleic-acid-binding protein
VIGFPTIVVVDPALLLRALEVYEVNRIDFAEAYLVASAEASGVETIASFGRAIDRVTTVRRVEPS